MSKPQLSIILIEFNSFEHVTSFISNIAIPQNEHEIIIVSNSDLSDNDKNLYRQQFPSLKILFNNKNLGFAKAINLGINRAQGDFIIVTNPFCQFLNIELETIKSTFKNYLKTGIIGPSIVNTQYQRQESFRKFMIPSIFVRRQISRLFVPFPKIISNPTTPTLVDWIIGACMIMKREVFEALEGFDEKYFLYVEDMDFCYRAQQKGFNTLYVPELQVQYSSNRRSVKSLNKYTLIHFKSYIHFLRKTITI